MLDSGGRTKMRLPSVMLPPLLLVSLLITNARAMTDAQILWGGQFSKTFLLVPSSFPNVAPAPPHKLTIKDTSCKFGSSMSHFTAKPDSAITWNAAWCMEANGTTNGALVRMNHCTGGPAQKWNLLRRGTERLNWIQLKGTTKCVDVLYDEAGLDAPSIVLEECQDKMSESWTFETLPLPTSRHSYPRGSFTSSRRILSYLVFLSILGGGSLGIWSWCWQRAARESLISDQNDIPSNMDQGGLCLTTPLSVHQVKTLRYHRRWPTAMALSPTSDEDGQPSNMQSLPACNSEISPMSDRLDISESVSASKTHLVVAAHGLVGAAKDLDYLVRRLCEVDQNVCVLATRVNEGFKTLDGVAAGAERIANDVKALISSKEMRHLSRISFVGNSLGGLYVRHAIASLFDTQTGTIAGLTPAYFVTIATPHLGVARHTYIDVPDSLKGLILHNFMGQTGYDLNLSDTDGTRQGVLYRMATSQEFLVPLKSFKKRRLYANLTGDFMVPFGTAAIESEVFDIEVPARAAIVRVIEPAAQGSVPLGVEYDAAQIPQEQPVEEKAGKNELIETMIGSLSPLFEKVIVNFPQRLPLSHNKIAALEKNGVTSKIVAKVCGFSEGAFVMDELAEFLTQR